MEDYSRTIEEEEEDIVYVVWPDVFTENFYHRLSVFSAASVHSSSTRYLWDANTIFEN